MVSFAKMATFFFGIAGAGNLLKFSSNGKLIHDFGRAIRYHSSFDGTLIAVVGDSVTQIYSDAAQ